MESRPRRTSSRPAAPVRVVASICAGAATRGGGAAAFQVADSSSAGFVSLVPLNEDRKPARPTTGASAPRKDLEYRIDCCYPKDGDPCNKIFDAEVKPLVHALFTGANACVVACGAAAKTNLVMESGLLTKAMEEIFLLAQPIAAAVSVSSYQVLQDTHVFDLLEPKDTEVLVQEDANKRTNLKGLSTVRINSIEEFRDLSSCGANMPKHPTKPSSNHLQPRAGHHGFIIYISTLNDQGKGCHLAKMDFLDLAGYVDSKERTNLAPPNCNKSFNALMKVVQALNTNQGFIPYRESKLTRILQDSLCKSNRAVLIACLDEFSNQDTVSTLSLASRSSQVVNEPYYNLSSGTRSSAKSNIRISASSNNLSSIHQPNSALGKNSRLSAVKARRTPTVIKRSRLEIHSAKKSVSSLSTYTKQRGDKSALNGRKLFCPGSKLSKGDKVVAAPAEVTNAEVLKSSSGMGNQGSLPAEGFDEKEKVGELVPSIKQELVSISMQEEDHLSSDLHADHSCANLDQTCSSDVTDKSVDRTLVGATQTFGKLTQVLSGMQEQVSRSMQQNVPSSDLHVDHLCANLEETCSSDIADDLVDKTPLGATELSPNVIDRLREITNSLKLLSTMPLSVTPAVHLKSEPVGVQDFEKDLPEPKTPEVHLKSEPFGVQEFEKDLPEPKTPEVHLKSEPVGVQDFERDLPEPKTPEVHLKSEAVGVQDFERDLPEPKTPEVNLNFGHAGDSHVKARTTGVKKSLAKECLTFLNSANKEQLKSLKGIGEKRANYILELREESPELFKEVVDLKIIGMNNKEIKTLMASMVMDEDP